MLRRSGSERPTKVQRGGPKARKAATSHASTGDLQDQIAAVSRELKEAREQQAATSDVLRVISSSPTELLSVLDMVGEDAARLCDANNAVIFRLEGDILRQVASYGGIPTTSHPSEGLPANRDTVSGRAVCDRRTIHVDDLASEDREYPSGSRHAKSDGHRTTLATPLLREGTPIGAILIRRMEVRPFSGRQIALLETFANQAVIAIENVRLFDAEQQRTRELSEALEQQTAASKVLEVISRSQGDLQPVFTAMLESATRLCEARYGALWLCEGDAFRTAALHGQLPQLYIDQWRSGTLIRPNPKVLLARVAASGKPLQIEDLRADPSYLSGDPLPVAGVEIAGVRTLLCVPMFKDAELIGEIAIYRTEIKPFTEQQIELLTNFAAQAVIAVENARL